MKDNELYAVEYCHIDDKNFGVFDTASMGGIAEANQ
jgi:hypothetical protein